MVESFSKYWQFIQVSADPLFGGRLYGLNLLSLGIICPDSPGHYNSSPGYNILARLTVQVQRAHTILRSVLLSLFPENHCRCADHISPELY